MRDYTDKCLMAQQIDGVRWPRMHDEWFNTNKANHAHHRLTRIKHFRYAAFSSNLNFSVHFSKHLAYVSAMMNQIER